MATTKALVLILLIYKTLQLCHGNATSSTEPTIYGVSLNSTTGNEIGQITATFIKDFCMGDVIINDDVRRKCCSFVNEDFSRVWFRRGHYLTDFLTEIKRMECSHFRRECEEPTYDFNPFTELVYKRFCDPQELVNVCSREIAHLLLEYNEDIASGDHDNNTTWIEHWKFLADNLDPDQLWLRELIKPCVQVAMFDHGRFTEIVQPFAPFCAMTWTGYDVETAIIHQVSPWTSMSMR